MGCVHKARWGRSVPPWRFREEHVKGRFQSVPWGHGIELTEDLRLSVADSGLKKVEETKAFQCWQLQNLPETQEGYEGDKKRKGRGRERGQGEEKKEESGEDREEEGEKKVKPEGQVRG